MQQLLCRDAAIALSRCSNELPSRNRATEQRKTRTNLCFPGRHPASGRHLTRWKNSFYVWEDCHLSVGRNQAPGITLPIVRQHVAKHPATRCQPAFLKCLNSVFREESLFRFYYNNSFALLCVGLLRNMQKHCKLLVDALILFFLKIVASVIKCCIFATELGCVRTQI